MEKKVIFTSVDEYIAMFPLQVQTILRKMRQIIHEEAPNASEKISYQMPTFYLHGNLVHFAAYKNHIGFYPTPSGVSMFEKELAPYKTAKGSINFPLNKPLPFELIRAIVKQRVKENLTKANK
ncbi:MAG TPA: DUF1801 domain-containing protein [Bacilli bacterium]|nr:DUF1801 domain-containing protein [Bacilli bacterium]